jgi:prepilin-type N-terminal cleavage/methylation domain-containing protein
MLHFPVRSRPSGPRSRLRAGFSLIELLAVVLLISALAAVAILKSGNMKDKGFKAAMLSDLHHLSTSQETYFHDASTYSTNLAVLKYVPSPGVAITIPSADNKGWSAKATHSSTSQRCAVFYGTAAAVAPATVAGVPVCK